MPLVNNPQLIEVHQGEAKNNSSSANQIHGASDPQRDSAIKPIQMLNEKSGSRESSPTNNITSQKSVFEVKKPDTRIEDLPTKETTCRNLLGGNAYKRRNVYKSVVRHMFTYIRKNREEIMATLRGLNYTDAEIEHSFFEVSCYNDEQSTTGNIEKSQLIIKKILSSRSIYTIILCESLKNMLNKWELGKLGKVSQTNLETYKFVAKKLYDEAMNVIKSNELKKA